MPVPATKDNNFDLLRLLAAIQIAAYHAFGHLHFTSPLLNTAIYSFRYFFGIHILFTISGFLIFSSYDRSPGIISYTRNRLLRVYPGLWVCLAITICSLIAFGYINLTNIFSTPLWLWLVAQVSFFQFYTPAMLRPFGVHNPNGALWTIPVELAFYAFIPLLFWLSGKIRVRRNLWILLFMALSVAYNVYYQPYKFQADRTTHIKLMGINLAPYLFYFLLGAIAANNWDKIKRYYEGKGLVWLAAYLIYSLVFCHWGGKYQIGYWTNPYHFIAVLLLSQATISLAYTCRNLGNKLLFNNDFSYGVYIYHMVIINALVEMGYRYNNYSAIFVVLPVALLAYASWRFIEKPALSLKKHSSV